MVVVSMYSLFYFFPENLLCTYYVPKIVKKKKSNERNAVLKEFIILFVPENSSIKNVFSKT